VLTLDWIRIYPVCRSENDKKEKRLRNNLNKPSKNPFGVGLDAEQVLADSLCAKFLERRCGSRQHRIEAFVLEPFRDCAHRMLHRFSTPNLSWNKLGSMGSKMIAEENGEVHVCDDCRAKKKNPIPWLKKLRNKMH